jgi:hypothetical protein
MSELEKIHYLFAFQVLVGVCDIALRTRPTDEVRQICLVDFQQQEFSWTTLDVENLVETFLEFWDLPL